jgi:hypothetical protein
MIHDLSRNCRISPQPFQQRSKGHAVPRTNQKASGTILQDLWDRACSGRDDGCTAQHRFHKCPTEWLGQDRWMDDHVHRLHQRGYVGTLTKKMRAVRDPKLIGNTFQFSLIFLLAEQRAASD